jgi:hypothetical protein
MCSAYVRNIDDIEKLIILLLEQVMAKTIPNEQRFVLVFDLSGFTYSCMDYEAVKVLISTLQFNYPDTLGTAFVVNEPWIFSACWAIIRGWIDPVTASKVKFIGVDQLEEYIDRSSIPEDVFELV